MKDKTKAVFKVNQKHDANIVKHEENKNIRLNKYLGDLGITSRRNADKWVEMGRVFVNDVQAVIGMKIKEEDVVKVDGKVVGLKKSRTYIMLHKPTGITCTNDLNVKGNIRAFVSYPELIYPVGRLDKDSSGLILLTNDGDVVNKILRREYGHEKEYVVTVDKDYDDQFIKNMQEGVLIYNEAKHHDEITAKSSLTKLDSRTFKIILKQGLNRQIRRMTKALGYNVKSLKRVRIMHLKLGDLEVGKWRYLTNKELETLNDEIKVR